MITLALKHNAHYARARARRSSLHNASNPATRALCTGARARACVRALCIMLAPCGLSIMLRAGHYARAPSAFLADPHHGRPRAVAFRSTDMARSAQ